jgi:hypothetical protein
MKGDVTINVIISGLFAIGVAAFSLYLLFKFFQWVYVQNLQAQTERNAVNLLNALISHEKLIYEKDGIKYRGVLSANKLDDIFRYKSYNGLNLKDILTILNPENRYWITSDKLDLWYSDALSFIAIIDLDDCNENRCVVWAGIIVSLTQNLLWDSPLFKFGKCLFGTFSQRIGRGCEKGAEAGKWFGWIGEGLGCVGGAFFQFINIPGHIQDMWGCAKVSLPPSIKLILEGKSPITQRGLPVSIIYEDGSIHKGRVMIGILEMVE